jgi:hypothetical protein
VDYIRDKYEGLAGKMDVVHMGAYMDNWRSVAFSKVCLSCYPFHV